MKLSTKLFVGFSVVIVLSIMDSYVNNMLSKKVNKNISFLANSEAIIRNSSRLHKGIIEMQSGFRGFLLTDDEYFLEPYYKGLQKLPELVEEEKKLIIHSKPQTQRLDSIYSLHKNWVNYANSLINAKKESLAARSITKKYNDLFDNKLRKQVGNKLNQRITEIFKEFDRYEYSVREERRMSLVNSIESTETSSSIFLILTISIGVISSLYIVRLISNRIALMVNLAENISKGQFALVADDKNDELTSLSMSLNTMSQTLNRNINELEKKNAELNQFAYVVSHDLKAPIRGIYNVIQWIEEDLSKELSSQMRRYLSIIPERIKRMEDLIHGLLDYARISREIPLKEKVDVNILVKEIVDALVPESFIVKINSLPSIYTEKVRLEQVFSNLISNSVKCNYQGNINISCIELDQCFEFTVSDDGIGIDPKYHNKIFEIFQTLREKNAKESTGVGLAIVKKIVEDRHCTVKVNSKLDQGASFIFTWPKN